jgi:hypothetical protein
MRCPWLSPDLLSTLETFEELGVMRVSTELANTPEEWG